MAVTTKKQFPATSNATTTVFSPVGIQLNNQDDLDVYVTLSGGTRVLQLRQSTGSTAQSSHPQVNNTDGLYFPAVTAGTNLINYTLSTDNNTITFNSALPQGAVVFCERRTRDADSSYTTFASGSTIRATDLNNSSTESNFTAQDGRNKAFTIEGVLFRGDQPSTNFVTSDHIVAGTIVNTDIADDAINTAKIADNAITRATLADDAVGTQEIADNAITAPKINAAAVENGKIAPGAVTTDKIANGTVTRAKLEADIIDGTKLADNAVDSEHYTDGSIDRVHLEADIIDSTKLADNAVNSEHYVDGSIDHVHLSNDCVDEDNIQDDAVRSEHIQANAVTDSEIATGTLDNRYYTETELDAGQLDNRYFTEAELNGGQLNTLYFTEAEITGGAADGRYYTETELDAGQLDNRYFTETELTSGALDGRYYTETEAEARFLRQDSSETIASGATWSNSDAFVATTAAINARIIDLIDEVGGFTAIANQTSFPTTNPQGQTGQAAILSIQATTATLTPSGTTVTIPNGAGSGNTVTITGVTATIPTGFGFLVESTSTTHTYTFHRLVPKATEVTTVATNINNIVTAGQNVADINNFADIYIISSSEPTTRNDGSSLQEGDLWFDSSNDNLQVYTGSSFSIITPSQSVLDDVAIVSGAITYSEDLGLITDAVSTGSSNGSLDIVADALEDEITFTVTVSGGKFVIDGVSAPALTLYKGWTYTFDVSDSSTSGHPLRFQSGGSAYNTGVTVTGTQGSSGAKVQLVVPESQPTSFQYYCTNHSGMGNTITVKDDPLKTVSDNVVKIIAAADNSSNINAAVANASNINSAVSNASNINAAVSNASNINTVASNNSNVTAVAGKATEIGRLGTADAVADLAILGTTDVVSDMNTLGTSSNVTNMNTLAGISTNVTTVANIAANVTTVAGNNSNVTAVAGNNSNITAVANNSSNINAAVSNASNINAAVSNASNINAAVSNATNINTVAGNITDVNNFADQYQIANSNPSTDGGGNALSIGDLYFNSSANELRIWNGTQWQGGVTATGNLSQVTGSVFTGDNRYNDNVKLKLGTDSDLQIFHNTTDSIINASGAGNIKLQDQGNTKLEVTSSGVTFTGTVTAGTIDGTNLQLDFGTLS